MKEKKHLECDYCGVPITEKDYKCPNCGADCSKNIKKYLEEKEKTESEANAKQQQLQDEIAETVLHSFKRNSTVARTVFIIIFIFAIAMFILIMFLGFFADHGESESGTGNSGLFGSTKQEKVTVGYNEKATVKDYAITLDSYEYYAYDSEYFSDVYRTKDGYQKIAFHFILEGLSSSEVDTYFDANVSLKADDYVVSDAGISKGMHEYVVTGKESYPKFQGSVTEGEKLQGYLGFLVPKDKKELKFKVGEYITIKMDNPAYEGE